jgi:hypothetical protein
VGRCVSSFQDCPSPNCLCPAPILTPPTFPPQIEQWYEHHYPSFVTITSQSIDPADVRGRTFLVSEQHDQQRRIDTIGAGSAANGNLQQGQRREALRQVLLYIGCGLLVALVMPSVVRLNMGLSD